MTNVNKTQEGPSFETIIKCEGCKYLLSTYSLQRTETCIKLHKELIYRASDNSTIPHFDCPFKTLSQIKYHKSKEKEINIAEFDRVKSIITSIFKYSNGFENDAYTLGITFHCSETITLSQIKQLEEKLLNYDISFDSYDSEDISVTLDMKAV